MLLVIGYGSLLRGDDGIGPVLAKAACDQLPYVNAITCTQLTPNLAEPISKAKTVIFITTWMGGKPGAVSRQALVPAYSAHSHTGNVTPSILLTSAYELYGRMPEAVLISVAGASFGYESQLSPELTYALPTLHDTVQTWIASYHCLLSQ